MVIYAADDVLEFYSLFFLLVFSVVLSALFFGASYFLGVKQPDREKVSAYECGLSLLEYQAAPFQFAFF